MNTETINQLPDDPIKLKKYLIEAHDIIHNAQIQIKLLQHQLFGRKSEKTSNLPLEQLRFFDEAEVLNDDNQEAESPQIEVQPYKRSKRGRRAVAADIPEEIIVHDVEDDEKKCGCGDTMHKIGEDKHTELDYIPAQFKKITHIWPRYACKNCEGSGDEERAPVVTAEREPSLIAKGMLSINFIAAIITAKFCDALPLYRQEKIYARHGVYVPRKTMSRYLIEIIKKHPLLEKALDDEVLSGPSVNIDETVTQVLNEPGRSASKKSYMWVRVGGPPGKPVVIYHYAPSRGSDVAKAILKDFYGYVQCDAYKGYEWIVNCRRITIVSCLAHIRRKFVEILKVLDKAPTAQEAIQRIKDIYQEEKKARKNKLKDDELVAWRRKYIKPLLESLDEWLSSIKDKVDPSSNLGKAVLYGAKYTKRLFPYIEQPSLTLDNNVAENAIRPFVIGRKNWMFFNSAQGAFAAGVWYSLIETAKANGLESYRYLVFLLQKLPYANTLDDYKALLPHRLDLSTRERLSGKNTQI